MSGGGTSGSVTLNNVYLPSFDTRTTNPAPNTGINGIRYDFKNNSANGLSDGGGYNGVMTWRSYGNTTDLSGGQPIQLAYTANGNLWKRMGSTTSWATWYQFYSTSDFAIADYLPLAGGTMTGATLHGDNVLSRYGTGNDFSIYHNGTDGYLQNETGDLLIPGTSGQYVGIGTTSPNSKLHVFGGSANTELKVTTNDNYIARLGLYEEQAGVLHGGFIQYRGESNDRLEIGSRNSGTDTVHMSIADVSGSVSIRTTTVASSTTLLNVRGDIALVGENASCGIRYIQYHCPDDKTYNVLGVETTGLTVSGRTLHPSNGSIIFQNQQNNNQFYIRNSGGGNTGSLQIGYGAVGSNTSFFINGAGNIGMGNTVSTNSVKLEITGRLLVKSSDGVSDLYLGSYGGTNYFRLHTNNADTYLDMNSGNLYWRQQEGSNPGTRYTFFPSTANMTVQGTITQNSDIRIKENVVEISDCISKVQAMRGVYYNRTDFNTEVTKVGVIAQEVETVLPELILESPEDGLKSVAYAELTAVLINAIKEQQEIIEDLKTRITKLEN